MHRRAFFTRLLQPTAPPVDWDLAARAITDLERARWGQAFPRWLTHASSCREAGRHLRAIFNLAREPR
jgi:hypothetical protein